MGNLRFKAICQVQYRPMQQFFGQMGLLKAEVDRFERQQQTVLLVSSTTQQEKLMQAFKEHEIYAVETTPEKIFY